MESIARLELQFSRALSDKVAQRDLVLSNLDEKYMASIKELEKSSSINKQSDINRFEQQYHLNRLQMEINWNSDISALREEQKRDFRSFIMNASSVLLMNSSNCANDENGQDNEGDSVFVNEVSLNIKPKDKEIKNKVTKSISRSKSSSTIMSKFTE